eukprot:scaffold13.g208.t1
MLAAARKARWRQQSFIERLEQALGARAGGALGPTRAAGLVGGQPEETAQQVAERAARVVKHAFNRAPEAAAAAILKECSELDRVHLILALKRFIKDHYKEKEMTAYVNDLIKDMHPNSPHRRLTKADIASAVEYQRSLRKLLPVATDVPSRRQVRGRTALRAADASCADAGALLFFIAAASGLPFAGFGFVDNAVMLLAGEQIDAAFGVRFGLTTLASAALGNLVADVVGVSVTHQIQGERWLRRAGAVREGMRRVLNPPRLTKVQQSLPAVKWAQLAGAVVGVSLGCLVGMSPLAIMEPGFFNADRAAEAAATAAATAADGAGS